MVQAREAENPPRHRVKSAAAFRTISEVADELDLPQHVLRFWETKFPNIQPMKRGGGRRYYRPEDLVVLRKIRDLLYVDGYTIKGVQKLLRQNTVKNAPKSVEPAAGKATKKASSGPGRAKGAAVSGPKLKELEAVLGELEEIKGLLRDQS
ncbi:MAG: MerR family transcriptional regulator [Rhodospirillales bacterium]